MQPVRVGIATALVALGAAILPRPAAASPLFELIGDSQGRGGLTARISSDGAAATYFNPALLVNAKPGLDLGVFILGDEIGIVVDGRLTAAACEDQACDVPEVDGRGPESFSHQGNEEPIENPAIPTRWLQQGREKFRARPRQDAGSGHHVRAYQSVGLVTPVFGGRLMLGMFAMIPLGEFTTAKAFYNDEREQYFSNSLHPELYSDRLTATSLAFGGGFRIHPRVALGATFTLSLANHAAAPVYVSNLNNLDTVLLDSDVAVEAAVAPHFGIAWDALPRLRVAATLHTSSSFKIDTGFNYTLANGVEQSAALHFTHSYLPLTVGAGATYLLRDEPASRVSLAGVATYARWSDYKDRHSETPSGEYRWADTMSASLGVRVEAGVMHVWLDGQFQPTPVPPQTGRSNYVDNDRVGLATGADIEFELWGSRFRAGMNFAGHRLIERHVTKFIRPDGAAPEDYEHLVRDEIPSDAIDIFSQPVTHREGLQTNNPGFPGFSSSGWVLGGGVHVAVQY